MRLALLLAFPMLVCLAQAARAADEPAPVVSEAVVAAPLDTAWAAFTTKGGIEAWMVAHTEIDLKVEGVWRTHYRKEGVLGDEGTIEHRILSLDPKRMLSFRTVKCPKGFPFVNAIAKMWTVVYFEPVDAGHTKVTCRSLGFDSTEESKKMRAFFEAGNAQTMEELKKHFPGS